MWGKSVERSVDLGGRRVIKKKKIGGRSIIEIKKKAILRKVKTELKRGCHS